MKLLFFIAFASYGYAAREIYLTAIKDKPKGIVFTEKEINRKQLPEHTLQAIGTPDVLQKLRELMQREGMLKTDENNSKLSEIFI